MKIAVARKEFTDTLKIVAKALAVKSNTPILSGIYLSAAASCVEIQATDSTVGIIAKIAANVEEEGETVIIGKKLCEIALKLDGDIVTISTDEHGAEIHSNSAKYNLLTYNADDFPKIQVEEDAQTFTLRQAQFKDLVRKTAFSVSKDDSRPIFTGVLFKIDGENLTLAATDTHRLAVATEKISVPIDEFKFIVPAKILQDISAMFDVGKEIKIGCANSKATFIFDNLLVTARLIAGVYPDFEKVFPKENEIFATIEVVEFKNALERVAIIAKETEYQTVNFVFANDALKISAFSSDIGEAEEYILAKISGGELEISFNYSYFTDVLKILDAEKITLGMKTPLAPIDLQVGNFRYVATPVRRQ